MLGLQFARDVRHKGRVWAGFDITIASIKKVFEGANIHFDSIPNDLGRCESCPCFCSLWLLVVRRRARGRSTEGR
jgi:hypothetical protein